MNNSLCNSIYTSWLASSCSTASTPGSVTVTKGTSYLGIAFVFGIVLVLGIFAYLMAHKVSV